MSDYDNPEWIKYYRKVIIEQILKFHKGEITGAPYSVAEEYFPGDIERQADLCMSIGETLGRAQELGYPEGEAPTELHLQMARKYGVEKVFNVEVIKLRTDGSTGIIDREILPDE